MGAPKASWRERRPNRVSYVYDDRIDSSYVLVEQRVLRRLAELAALQSASNGGDLSAVDARSVGELAGSQAEVKSNGARKEQRRALQLRRGRTVAATSGSQRASARQ